MRVCVLASGSKGNSTLVSVSGINFLIDAGMTASYIETKLNELNISKIDYVLITHTHVDHVSALKVFEKKHRPKVVITKKMMPDFSYLSSYMIIEDELDISGVSVKAVKLSHDASDSVAYIISSNEKSMVYLTDTGYINNKNMKHLKNHSLYVFESNHDVEMLMDSSRPHHIKVRILGDKGHLSNEDSASYLEALIGPKTEYIVLAHLSSEANNQDKVLDAHKYDVKKIIAMQNERTELIEL